MLIDEEAALNMIKWNAKGGPSGERSSCDENCRKSLYCDYSTSYSDDR